MLAIAVFVSWSLFALSEASWPRGKYCLPMPSYGYCPSGWKPGQRKHDNEDDNGNGKDCHKKKQGYVPKHKDSCSNLVWNFCCKTEEDGQGTWPKGSYCIFRYGKHCPKHFATGSILWDDEDTNNVNSVVGTLPDGEYGENTRIFFCCRSDGGHKVYGLPKCSELVLMRYDGICPESPDVYLGPHTGFLQWDTEDDNNMDKPADSHPDGVTTFASGIKIEFCSYLVRTCPQAHPGDPYN